jgi:hypothetical protein
MKSDARIPLAAVPVAPVPLQIAEPHGKLVERGLDLLKAQDIRLLAFDELLHVRLSRSNAVDVPRGDLHHAACLAITVSIFSRIN